MVISITSLKIYRMYLPKINMIFLGVFSEIIAHKMYQQIEQFYNNRTVCELRVILPEFWKDVHFTDVNVYIRSYGM